eukprot:2507074-Rhodomonas_salina.2
MHKDFGSAWPAAASGLGRHDLGLDLVVEGIAGLGVGSHLGQVPKRESDKPPRSTIPDVADSAVEAVEAAAELAAEESGRDEGLVGSAAFGAEREDLHDLIGRELGGSVRRRLCGSGERSLHGLWRDRGMGLRGVLMMGCRVWGF